MTPPRPTPPNPAFHCAHRCPFCDSRDIEMDLEDTPMVSQHWECVSLSMSCVACGATWLLTYRDPEVDA
jgi:hypothetical protein